MKDDNRWYWLYNSGLQAQLGKTLLCVMLRGPSDVFAVYYRSKDSQLPDRSNGADDGEVFFDVRLPFSSDLTLLIGPSAKRLDRGRNCVSLNRCVLGLRQILCVCRLILSKKPPHQSLRLLMTAAFIGKRLCLRLRATYLSTIGHQRTGSQRY